MPAATLLSISGVDLGLYSARGLTMDLALISTPDLRRNWNGTLVNTANNAFHKYEVTITNEDDAAPVLTGVKKGDTMTVLCIPDIGVSDATDGSLTLSMMVTDYKVSRKEWDGRSSWTISLAEI